MIEEGRRSAKRGSAGIIVQYSVKEPLKVRGDFGERERDAIAHDLGAGGLSLYTDYDLPQGTIIVMKFRLSNRLKPSSEEGGSRKMELRGEARHSEPASGERSSYLIGIRFIKLSADDLAFIGDYVC